MAECAKASPCNSVDSVLFDFFNSRRVGGFRVAEYAQKTQTKVNKFKYLSGNKVVKAFIATEWKCYNAAGCLMTLHNLDNLVETPQKLRIMFRIQKKRRNGQKITFAANDKHSHICPIWLAYRILLQAKRQGHADNQPMGVYLNHQGIMEVSDWEKNCRAAPVDCQGMSFRLDKRSNIVFLFPFWKSLGCCLTQQCWDEP